VKKQQSITMVLSVTMGLLVLMLVAILALAAKEAFDRQRAAAHIVAVVELARDMYQADESVRFEQAAFTTALTLPQPANEEEIARIAAIHRATNRALDVVTGPREESIARLVNHREIAKDRLLQQKTFDAAIATLRVAAPQRSGKTHDDYVVASNALVRAANFQSDILTREYSGVDVFVDELTKVGRIAWDIRAQLGPDRRMILNAITAGQPLSADSRRRAGESKGAIDASWTILQGEARLQDLPRNLKESLAHFDRVYFHDFRPQREAVLTQLDAGRPSPLSAQQWLVAADGGIASLEGVSKTALDLIILHVSAQGTAATRQLMVAIGFILVALVLAGFAAHYLLRRVISPLNMISQTMQTVIGGDLDCPIPLQERQDEIGQFARTLRAFRDGAVERQRLETEKNTAEAASRIKSEFLANMSHELRTPLNAIIGFSGVMQEKMFGPLAAKYEEYANLIHESGHHLLNLISDILDVAKIEAGKFVLDLHQVDLEETADYCFRLNQRRAGERGILLTRAIAKNLPALTADPRAMKQILLNLLSNAVKFTGSGGEVQFTADCVGGRLRLAVRDNGRGIPAQVLDRIGNAFEQASNDPMCAREGTGLGLALVRALVDRHGGTFQLESEEGLGTVVTVELPFTQENIQAVA
jgi:signal transduction histidine kinase